VRQTFDIFHTLASILNHETTAVLQQHCSNT